MEIYSANYPTHDIILIKYSHKLPTFLQKAMENLFSAESVLDYSLCYDLPPTNNQNIRSKFNCFDPRRTIADADKQNGE